MKNLFLLIILSSWPLCAHFSTESESKILYLAHKGEITQSLTYYLEEARKEGHHFPLLQNAALALLEEGMRHEDMHVRLLAVLGSGVALHKATLPLLKQALSDQPELQMAALHFLSRFQEDEATALLQEALSSPLLLMRLEAALILAKKQNPVVIDHLSSFYGKVPLAVKALFPEILVEIETEASTKFLKQLLSETEPPIRISTIIQAGLAKRDDLLESVRMLLTHPDYLEAEAAAFALGKFKDAASKNTLKKLVERNNPEVKLSALQALVEMEERECFPQIYALAAEKNLYAIGLLGECTEYPEGLSLLQKLAEDQNFDIKLNAHCSLLKLKDPQVLPFFLNILTEDPRDLGFHSFKSPGLALSYWKLITSYSQKVEKDPKLVMNTRRFKAFILNKSVELPEEHFFAFANNFFAKNPKSSLIPLFMELIANYQSEKSLEFLKTKFDSLGAPLVRLYATLELYRLTNKEIYEEKLLSFIKQERGKEFILEIPQKGDLESSPHLLSAKETSSFLMSAFETLASSQRPKVLESLIEAIAYGNPKNRYALAGILIRMTE